MAKETVSKEQQRKNLFGQFEKDYGKGSVVNGNTNALKCDVVSTGSINLNKALGVGGFPKGRIVEIYGPESSGKTTLTLEAIAQAHKNKESYCGFVDMEHALDTKYAASLGVDLNRLDISQPEYGEQALEIARKMIQSGVYDIVVVDSVAALVPKAELDGEVEDNKMGLQARMMGKAMRMLTPEVSKTNTCVIFLNQLREKIGVMFGSPETTAGGNALKYYCSVRCDIRRVTTNKDGDEAVSNKVRVKVVKNKVAPPFKQAEFNIVFGEGIDKFDEAVETAVKLGIVNKSGSWYSYNGDKIGQGIDSVKSTLGNNPELYAEIYQKIMDKYDHIEVKELAEEEKQKHLEDESNTIPTGDKENAS